MSGDGKRHLPLVKAADPAREDDEERPPWHWAFIGAVAVMLAWLLIAMIGQFVLGRLYPAIGNPLSIGPGRARTVLVIESLASLALAAFAGGVFVGRFGARARAKEASASGAIAIVPPWLLVAAGAPADAWPILLLLIAVLAPFAAAFAYAGGRVGLRLRPG